MSPSPTLHRRSLVWTIRTEDGKVFGGEVGMNPAGLVFDLSNRMLEIQYERSIDKKGQVKLTLHDEDLKFFDNPILMKGKNFDFSFGYYGDTSQVYTCKVSGLKGFRKVVVSADVVESKFDFEEKTKTWLGLSRSEIALSIAKTNSFKKFNILPTNDRKSYLQQKETDRIFLIRLGREIGYKLFTRLEEGVLTFHFHDRGMNQRPLTEFVWRGGEGDLKSFDIVENSILGLPQTIFIKGWDPTLRKEILVPVGPAEAKKHTSLGGSSEVTHPWIVSPETGEITQVKDRGARRFDKASKIITRPVKTQKDAEDEAQAAYKLFQEAQIKAKATVVGHPAIEADMLLRFSGLPKMLAGNYHVEKVVQKITTGGYVTEVGMIRDAHTSLPVDPSQATSATGTTNDAKPKDAEALIPMWKPDPEDGTVSMVYRRQDGTFITPLKSSNP